MFSKYLTDEQIRARCENGRGLDLDDDDDYVFLLLYTRWCDRQGLDSGNADHLHDFRVRVLERVERDAAGR